MSFLSRLFGAQAPGDSETRVLVEEVRTLREKSTCFRPGEELDLAYAVMDESAKTGDSVLGMRIGVPVYKLLKELADPEPLCLIPELSKSGDGDTLASRVAYREQLRQAKRMLENEEYFVDKWGQAVGGLLDGMYEVFPEEAFVDPDADGNFEEFSAISPTVPLYSLVPDLGSFLSRLIGTFFANGLPEDGLLEKVVSVAPRPS